MGQQQLGGVKALEADAPAIFVNADYESHALLLG